MRTKNAWEKEPDEFSFNEMVDWIVGRIIFGIAKGETLHDIVYLVLTVMVNYKMVSFANKKEEK